MPSTKRPSKPRPTQLNLTRLYQRLRKKYFTPALPRDTLVKWFDSRDLMGVAILNSTPPVIQIERSQSRWPKLVEMTLLHEMAHLSSGDPNHAPSGRWHREMHRLARAGGFNKLW